MKKAKIAPPPAAGSRPRAKAPAPGAKPAPKRPRASARPGTGRREDRFSHESEARYHSLVEASMDAVLLTTPDGRTLAANQAACRMFGYSEAELIRLGREGVVDATDPRLAQALAERARTGRFAGEITMRRRDGSTFPGEVSSVVFRTPEGVARTSMVIRDVTSRKKAEAELLRSRAELQAIYEHAPIMMCVLDASRQVTYANRAFAEFVGRPAEHLLHERACGVIGCLGALDDPRGCGHGPSCEDCAVRLAMADALASGRSHRGIEYRTTAVCHGQPRDSVFLASVAPIEVSGQPSLLLCLDDITERERLTTERELTLAILERGNASANLREFVRAVTALLRKASGCEAVGVRIQEGEDFPYFETTGFSDAFVRAETRLCVKNLDGQMARDSVGNPVLDCMCGNILRGRFDPAKPFFTLGGSFWTNGTTELLATTTEADRQARTRNRCNGEGYESVALIPLRAGDRTLGLIQFNDRRKDRFTPNLIRRLEHVAAHVAVTVARWQAEEARQRGDARYRQIVDLAEEGIWVADREWKTTFANARMERIMGCPPGGMLGRHIGEFMDEAGRSAARELIHDRERGLRSTHEFQFVRPDGSRLWALVATNPILDESGAFAGALAMVTDISMRKRAEDALRGSEERLRLAQKATHDVIWDWNVPADRQLWSDAGGSVFGWTDILHKAQTAAWWLERLHPEDRPRVEAGFGAVVNDPGRDYWADEYRFRRADGLYARVVDRAYVIRDDQGRATRMIGAMLDITPRRQAQERVEFLAEAASTLLNSQTTESEVASLCQQASRLLHCEVFFNYLLEPATGRLRLNACGGIPDEAASSLRWLEGETTVCGYVARHRERMVAEDIGQVPEARTELVRSLGLRAYACHPLMAGDVMLGTLSFGTATRPRFAPEEVGFMQTFASLMAMATWRAQTQAALRASESKYRSLVQNANDAVFVHEMRPEGPGRFLEVNQRACEMLGYTREELLELEVRDIDVPEQAVRLPRIVASLGATGRATFQTQHRRKDGRRLPVEISARQLELGGRLVTLSVARDITERLEAQEALHQLSARLLQAQDEERRRVARELHDTLAQSLAALCMNLDLFRKPSAKLDEPARRLLAECASLAERCALDARTFSYLLHPPILEELGLAGAVREHADGFARRSGLRVDLELPETLGRLPRDTELALFRVLQEALSNVHRHSGSQTASIVLSQTADQVCLEVRDSGRGMEHGLAEGPGRPSDPRLGVGILGMRERMRQLGGSLMIESDGRGTRVMAAVPWRMEAGNR